MRLRVPHTDRCRLHSPTRTHRPTDGPPGLNEVTTLESRGCGCSSSGTGGGERMTLELDSKSVYDGEDAGIDGVVAQAIASGDGGAPPW